MYIIQCCSSRLVLRQHTLLVCCCQNMQWHLLAWQSVKVFLLDSRPTDTKLLKSASWACLSWLCMLHIHQAIVRCGVVADGVMALTCVTTTTCSVTTKTVINFDIIPQQMRARNLWSANVSTSSEALKLSLESLICKYFRRRSSSLIYSIILSLSCCVLWYPWRFHGSLKSGDPVTCAMLGHSRP
jgi:hypothetical protein